MNQKDVEFFRSYPTLLLRDPGLRTTLNDV